MRDNGRPSGLDRDDDDAPTPLRPGAARALAPSNAPREPRPSHEPRPGIGYGSPPDPRDPASEDLVRMRLRRQSTGSPLGGDGAPINGGPAPSPLPTDDETVPPARRTSDGGGDDTSRPPGGMLPIDGDDDATVPPAGLRARGDEGESHRRRSGGRGSESDTGPAPSPLRPEERRPSTGNDVAESPLRRPAPQPRRGDGGSDERPAEPPRGLDATARSPFQRDDSAPSPFQRGDAPASAAASNAAATTTAAMPAVRRREPPPSSSRPAPPRPAPTPGAVAIEDDETPSGGVLRWVVVLLLIAMGAAFGVWIGLQFIG